MPPETVDAYDAAPARQSAAEAPRPAPAPKPAPAPAPAFEPTPAFEDVPPAGSVPLEMEPSDYTPSASTKQPAGDDFLSMEADPFESLRRDADDDDPLAGMDFGGDDDDALGKPSGGATGTDDAYGGGFDGAELDDLLGGEPDPIPSMFARGTGDDDDDDAPARRKSRAGVWLLVAVLVVAGLAGGAWLFRERLVEAVPQLEDVFDSIGVPAAPLGYGLMFRDVTSDLVDRGNGQMLVVRGFIANDSERDRPMPFIRLALFDRTGAVLDQIVAEPPQAILEPGQTIGFRIQADNPSAATQRFTVDWNEPPALSENAPPPAK